MLRGPHRQCRLLTGSLHHPRVQGSALSPDIRIGAVAWRMRLLPQQQDVICLAGPFVNLFQILFITSMTSGQSVGILGRIGVWRVIALVCGHQTQAMIYFQRVRIIDNLDTFAYILFRYAVMVKPEGDIAVTHYCCGASLFHLMAYGGKRAEAVGLNLLELFPSGLGTPAHPASVEGLERFGYGRIQRLQRVEYKTLDVSVDGSVK